MHTTGPVRLSVVMAVRNGEPHVRDAIESVRAQSYADFEFLVVDDASTDHTRGILTAYAQQDARIRVLWNGRPLGPYPSANRALAEARGDVIARHDADDVSPPDRFAVQLAAFETNRQTSLVTGAVEVFGRLDRASRVYRPPAWQPRLEWDLLFTNVVGAGGQVMFPRVLHGERVLFPEKCLYAEDYGLWCSLTQRGRVACPAQIVYRYRQHAASITSREKLEQDHCLSRMRHEYQSRYLSSDVSCETSTELARFWKARNTSSIGRPLKHLVAVFDELRANFLARIEDRYGAADRATLESEIDHIVGDRLGYWLYRAIRTVDGRAGKEVLDIARSEGQSLRVTRRATMLAASVVLRKLRHAGRRPALSAQ